MIIVELIKTSKLKLFKLSIFIIISFMFTIIFLSQSISLISVIDPVLILSFIGLPSDFLSIVIVMVLTFIIFGIIGPVLSDKIFQRFSLEGKTHKIIHNYFQRSMVNAIILFLVVLFAGITFSNMGVNPIGNTVGNLPINWFLFWFFLAYFLIFCFSFLFNWLIYKKKVIGWDM